MPQPLLLPPTHPCRTPCAVSAPPCAAQWAMREAHTFSRAVVQNALVPLSSSSEDLQDVSHCVAVVLACCLVLELDHGLSLVDEVQPELWGHLEGEGGSARRSCQGPVSGSCARGCLWSHFYGRTAA